MLVDFAILLSERVFSPHFYQRDTYLLSMFFFRGAHLVPFFCPHLNYSGEIHLVEIWHVEFVEDQ